MPKYFTIVIRAEDEHAARQLVPGEMIGPNRITGVSLGDALTLNECLKTLIPAEKEEAVQELEAKDLAAFFCPDFRKAITNPVT